MGTLESTANLLHLDPATVLSTKKDILKMLT
jgi:hypothetical protein